MLIFHKPYLYEGGVAQTQSEQVVPVRRIFHVKVSYYTLCDSVVFLSCFFVSPCSYNQLVSVQVHGQLGEILHSWMGELRHPCPECCTDEGTTGKGLCVQWN